MVAVPDSCRTGAMMALEFFDVEENMRPIHNPLDAPESVPLGGIMKRESESGADLYYECGCILREV